VAGRKRDGTRVANSAEAGSPQHESFASPTPKVGPLDKKQSRNLYPSPRSRQKWASLLLNLANQSLTFHYR
jgi:hypothetical protein